MILSRYVGMVLVGVAAFVGQPCLAEGLREMVVTRDLAERHGLVRSWIGRVQVDPSRGKVAFITHDHGTLFAQTTQGAVHAIDGETGRTLWVSYVGKSDYSVLRPAATPPFVSAKKIPHPGYVAAINGSTMYVLARDTGRILGSVSLDGAPSAGAVLTQGWAYVPLSNGMLQGFNLKDLKQTPSVYRGKGYALTPPVVTDRVVSWVTTDGFVYAAEQESLAPAFRFETRRSIEAPLSYAPGLIFVASRDGFVYAINEKKGVSSWQFSTGEQIVRQPITIDDVVYVTPEGGGIFSLDLATGIDRWFSRHFRTFISASPTRVYGFDDEQNMVVIDSKTGGAVDAFSTIGFDVPVTNTENDRIYLATSTGLVLSMHERRLVSPAVHGAAPAAAPARAAPAPDAVPAESPAAPAEAPAADPNNPFADS